MADVTIDFEASSLELTGYPIEVGLSLWPARDQPIFGWSALIRPAPDWSAHGHWSVASAKVYTIRGRDLVSAGHDPAPLAMALNEAVGPRGVDWCDGGPYDAHWLRALFTAAATRPSFSLGNWDHLAISLGVAGRQLAFEWLEGTTARHRARDDSDRLLRALAHGCGIELGPAQDLVGLIPALTSLGNVVGGE